jgi:TonB family protein
MKQDRRRHPRQPVTLPVYVGLNSPRSGGILHDVSEGGMALDIIIGPKPATDDVILDFDVPGAGEHLEVKCQITWTKEPENRVGFEFVNLTETSHEQIEKWLDANAAPPQKSDANEFAEAHGALEHDVKPEVPSRENMGVSDERRINDIVAEAEKFSGLPVQQPELRQPKKLRVRRLKEKVAIPNLAKDQASVGNPASQPEKMTEAQTSSAFDVVQSKATQAAAIQLSNFGLQTEKKKPETKKMDRQAAEVVISPAGLREQRDESVQEIRKRREPISAQSQRSDLSKVLAADGVSLKYLAQRGQDAQAAGLPAIGALKSEVTEGDVAKTAAMGISGSKPASRGVSGDTKYPATIERVMQTSQKVRIPADTRKDSDRVVQALRSSFGQSERQSMNGSSFESGADEGSLDWGTLRQWMVASVVLFLLIVSLAAARWIYTTPALDKISSAADIAKIISSSANGSGSSESVRNDIRKSTKSMSGSKGRGPAGMRARGGKSAQSAQKETIPERQLEKSAGSGAGHVSLLPAAELPEKITLPAYPAAALQNNLQGRIVFNALISKDGTLKNIRVVGTPSLLSAAALEVLKKWRYRPHIENGTPVEAETQITIDFEK